MESDPTILGSSVGGGSARSVNRRRLASWRQNARRAPSQSLVEFALVMPLLVVIFAVLLQFGILFMVYLNIMHITRDTARWLSVHPDNTDATVQAYVLGHLPTYLVAANFTWSFAGASSTWPWSPNCTALSSGQCTTRTALSQQRVSFNYNAVPHVLLPTTLGNGYWRVTVPWSLPRYDYYVMIEPH